MPARRQRAPREVVEVVRVVYPLVVNRHAVPVQLLGLAYQHLVLFAEETGRGEEWADMALRVMLEYERPAGPPTWLVYLDDEVLPSGRRRRGPDRPHIRRAA